MKHTLNECADDFFKMFWDEYAQKQQVSKFGRCGESVGSEQKKAASGPSELVRNTPPLSNEQRPIHLVPEPPAIPEEPGWSDSDTAREQYDKITGRS